MTGLGPVGLGAALVGRALGVRRIYGTDANPYRLNFAKEKVRCFSACACKTDPVSI